MEFLANKSPLKRGARPSEIAGLIAYIASDWTGYMTGSSAAIDCGSTL
ncbi:SDR family oxidoreductase (plasmid) [Novosphingobium sp. BL-8A]